MSVPKLESVDLRQNDKYEVYDYPGRVRWSRAMGTGRLASARRRKRFLTAWPRARARAAPSPPGHTFKLASHPHEDAVSEHGQSYLLTSIQHSASQPPEAMSEVGEGDYTNQFTCVGDAVQFRPERVTPKPVISGVQTAVVVGPAGEEIFTDKYGRVKVQFHWDREGKKDGNSSCWIRVSNPWAGQNWGGVAIPRIGQEVIVDFLEGDPDQPIITGRVYNAEQMPPYELPANMTQTGIKSRSTKGASSDNFNELRFEDKLGEEEVYIHAEKDMNRVVENNDSLMVGFEKSDPGDQTIGICHDRTETVGNNENITIAVNRTEDVGANETITIGGNRTISVGASEAAAVAAQRTHTVGINETISVGAAQEVTVGGLQAITVGGVQTTTVGANQSTDVGANRSVSAGTNASMSVGKDETRKIGANRSTDVGEEDKLEVGKKLTVVAGESVMFKTGKASISMKKDGTIVIKGKDITLQGSGKINIKASKDVVVKGSKIKEN